MYYLTITTLIHIYLIRVYCEKKININILNVVLIFLIIILKVRVFKLLNEPFATFIFAWLIIFILAQVLIGKNTKRNLELSFLIELINVLAYYISGGIVLITTQEFNAKDIMNFKLALDMHYIPHIIITTSILLSFGIFRRYIPLKFLNDNEEDNDLSGLFVILAINLIIKTMYNINLNYGIKFILFVGINIFVIIFYVKNRQLSVERVRGRKELREKEKVIEELSLYIETIEELVDKFKEFRHDCKNMLLGVGLDNSKIDELVDKVDEEVKSSTNYNIFLSLKDIKYSSLKSLLYYYIMNALKQEIEVKLTVLGTIENIAMSDLEFSRVLGIIFENATEAAIDSHEKKIDIYIEELNGKVNIAIGNTFKDKIENLKDLSKKGFSTKGENRGIGLHILKSIIDKNPSLKLETYINEEYFIQDLFL